MFSSIKQPEFGAVNSDRFSLSFASLLFADDVYDEL
jgi:hypothetical protein